MGRFRTAWQAFWQILGNDRKATAWQALQKTEEPEALPEPVEEVVGKESTSEFLHGDAVYSLVMLQRAGRLVDFLQEDISSFSDQQVGAAVRQIHQGCRTVLQDNFAVTSVLEGVEGSTVEIPADFDPARIRLTGNVQGQPPFKGVLRHGGWKADKVELPQRNEAVDASVITPAEVEI